MNSECLKAKSEQRVPEGDKQTVISMYSAGNVTDADFESEGPISEERQLAGSFCTILLLLLP